MKYVIDIDGTICDKPECREDCDYDTSIPKLDRIAKINKLSNCSSFNPKIIAIPATDGDDLYQSPDES